MYPLRRMRGRLSGKLPFPCSAQPIESQRGRAVSPAEVKHPALKSLEQTYFFKLVALNRSIGEMEFPFPFVLSRYVGLDAKNSLGADRRGLEFVMFHGRTILKLSGNYNAAFNADRMTENQRAERVLSEVIVPLLRLESSSFPSEANFAAYGFEISWHVRRRSRSYDYEGAEILTLVLNKDDALTFLKAQGESERQEVLSRSEVYVNGKEFGLALGERDPFPVTESESAGARTPDSETIPPPRAGNSENRVTRSNGDPRTEIRKAEPKPPEGGSLTPSADPAPKAHQPDAATREVTQADADALQKSCQKELDALAQEGALKFGFVDYAPPSFVIFQNRIYLQLTMRSPKVFDRDATSIYKLAAQSFDLFLAPLLKALHDKLPHQPEIAGLDITVVNQLNPKSAPLSEALEFICTRSELRQFTDAAITNQDFINQSIVLVNGVRISLDLQQVE